MLNYVMLFLLFLSVVIAAEIGSFCWHNFSAHTDIIPGIHATHKIHHTSDLSHEAHEDFYYIVVILIIIGLGLIYLWYYNLLLIDPNYLAIGYSIFVSVFVWNWYVHSAYHIQNHWLNNFDWFKLDKKIHLQHHVDPTVNYGIASHFCDIIMGTYELPFEDPTEMYNLRR